MKLTINTDFDKQDNMIFRIKELDEAYDAAEASNDDEPMEAANELAQQYLRLMRASPAMLQAMKLALHCVTYYHEHEGCPETLKRYQAAIAKAEVSSLTQPSDTDKI